MFPFEEKVVYHVIVKRKRGNTQYLYTYGAPERPGLKVFRVGGALTGACVLSKSVQTKFKGKKDVVVQCSKCC